MLVNGTVYPKLSVPAGPVRFRILNASHDRFLNLQLYRAVSKAGYTNPTALRRYDFTGTGVANLTEVAMVPAVYNAAGNVHAPGVPAGCFPASWPTDGREGGVPDPATRGPAFIQIGTEGGFLPAPVVLPNQPVTWNVRPDPVQCRERPPAERRAAARSSWVRPNGRTSSWTSPILPARP